MSYLHNNKQLFVPAMQECQSFLEQNGKNINVQSIEKDYWITLILTEFANTEFTHHIAFGGGTALSKAHQIIERFSEDIDFCSIFNPKSKTQQELLSWKAFDNIRGIAETKLSAEINDFKESRSHCYMEVKYPSFFMQNFILKDFLEVEILVSPQRYTAETIEKKSIQSFIGTYFDHYNRQDLSSKYSLSKSELSVVKVQYTLADKILRLARLGTAEDYVNEVCKCARDVYDITQILDRNEYRAFLSSKDFSDYALKKIKDDNKRYKVLNPYMLSQSKLFKNTTLILESDIFANSKQNFSNMLYNAKQMPSNADFLHTITFVGTIMKEFAKKNKLDLGL